MAFFIYFARTLLSRPVKLQHAFIEDIQLLAQLWLLQRWRIRCGPRRQRCKAAVSCWRRNIKAALALNIALGFFSQYGDVDATVYRIQWITTIK